VGNCVYPSRPDTAGKRNAENTGAGNEAKTSKEQKGFHNFQRQDCQETAIQKNHLNCFYTNANSLVQKIDELRDRVFHNDYDIVGVVEIWSHRSCFYSTQFNPG